MKYIKTLENRQNISVGDYVKIFSWVENFKKDDIFKVTRAVVSKNKYYLDQFGDDYFRRYQIERVLSQPTPDEVEEYRIRKNAKNYNL